MIKLYDHQKKIIADNPTRTGLFLGTGSCKTLTSLMLSEGTILCITPKQQNEEKNFQREADKWELGNNITQMSKEQFKKYADTLEQFDTVIFDECHTVAGVTPSTKQRKGVVYPKASQLYEAVMRYLKRCPPKRLYLLSATPDRSPMCVWGLSQMLGKNWNFYEFRDLFHIPVKRGFREFYIVKSDKKTKERLGRIVQSLGYTGRLEDYFDVPDQTYKTIKVDMTKEQKELAERIEIEYPDPIVLLGKRHQVENGVLSGDEFRKDEIVSDNKIPKILDLAAEFPKMVLFVKYTAQIEKIRHTLHKEGYDVLVLQGSTKDRGTVIERANAMEKCVIIIQSQISAGFELPTFPVMVFVSMSYSVVDRIQGEGRILRANALKKNLYITLVTKGGVDEAVERCINNKQDFHEKIYIQQNTKDTK